jgi:predicted RNA-binding Zn ribbon-like protein
MENSRSIETQSAGQLSLLAGRVSLDFANTVSGQGTRFEIDHMINVDAFNLWLRHVGLLKGPDVFSDQSDNSPAALRSVLALRDTINGIGTSLVNGSAPAEDDLAALCRTAGKGLPHLRLERRDHSGFAWSAPSVAALEAPLARLALDAIDILRFSDLSRLRRCQGEDCGWLFLDTSKNGKRRWCDMTVCGNRAKARRHRAKVVCTSVI